MKRNIWKRENISGRRTFMVYLKNMEKAIIIIHKIWVFNDNINDIARTVARENYMGFALHLYNG